MTPRRLLYIGLVLALPAVGLAAPEKRKAARSIWSASRVWKYDAAATGATGKSRKVKVDLRLTGKLKGDVATYRASFRFEVGQESCVAKVRGKLKEGSYAYAKEIPLVRGKIAFEKISSTCKLSSSMKSKVKQLTLPIQLGLVGKKLCAAIGGPPTSSTKDCFLVDAKKKRGK